MQPQRNQFAPRAPIHPRSPLKWIKNVKEYSLRTICSTRRRVTCIGIKSKDLVGRVPLDTCEISILPLVDRQESQDAGSQILPPKDPFFYNSKVALLRLLHRTRGCDAAAVDSKPFSPGKSTANQTLHQDVSVFCCIMLFNDTSVLPLWAITGRSAYQVL